MSEYDHLDEDVAIPAELMAGEEEFPPEPPAQVGLPDPNAYQGELPPDVASVWTGASEQTARVYIGAWGMDGFRNSALHRNAIKSVEREAKMEPIRAAFIKAKKEKK